MVVVVYVGVCVCFSGFKSGGVAAVDCWREPGIEGKGHLLWQCGVWGGGGGQMPVPGPKGWKDGYVFFVPTSFALIGYKDRVDKAGMPREVGVGVSM